MDLRIKRGEGFKDHNINKPEKELSYQGSKVDKAVFDLEERKIVIYTGGKEKSLKLEDRTWNSIVNSGSAKEAANKAMSAFEKICTGKKEQAYTPETTRKLDQLEMKKMKFESELFKLDAEIKTNRAEINKLKQQIALLPKYPVLRSKEDNKKTELMFQLDKYETRLLGAIHHKEEIQERDLDPILKEIDTLKSKDKIPEKSDKISPADSKSRKRKAPTVETKAPGVEMSKTKKKKTEN